MHALLQLPLSLCVKQGGILGDKGFRSSSYRNDPEFFRFQELFSMPFHFFLFGILFDREFKIVVLIGPSWTYFDFGFGVLEI